MNPQEIEDLKESPNFVRKSQVNPIKPILVLGPVVPVFLFDKTSLRMCFFSFVFLQAKGCKVGSISWQFGWGVWHPKLLGVMASQLWGWGPADASQLPGIPAVEVGMF